MIKAEYAQNCLMQGFCCSQSVLSAFLGEFDLDRDTALRISSAFGGGMGGQGEVCGAVSAAFMVIGLKYGSPAPHDDQERGLIGRKAGLFLNRFKSCKGSILCRDLLGADIGTLEGLETAIAKGLFDNICPGIIKSAVEIIDEIISAEADSE